MEREQVLPRWLAEIAARSPDAPVVVEADTGRTVSRRELHEASLNWAAVLAGLGVQAGETVLTMLQTSSAATSVWLGVAWLRAMEVPVNNDYRGTMLSYLVNDSAARVMVIDAA